MKLFRRRAGQEQTIKLAKADFAKYVTSRTEYYTGLGLTFIKLLDSLKNFSSLKKVVMFTAMKPERGCAICQEAAAEFHILASSIRYTGSQEGLSQKGAKI